MSLSALLIARIKSSVPALLDVFTGADLAALKEGQPLRSPTAFVFMLNEAGGANRYMTGAVAQKRSQQVAVVLAVRNVRDATGAKAQLDVDGLRAQVDAALFGWSPNAAIYDPLTFQRGGLVELSNGWIWWQDEYLTQFDRRT